MQRVITPELLDALPPDDPRAQKSRRDLQRINWWMGNAGKIAAWLKQGGAGKSFHRLIELGAGDGTFALKLARQLAPHIGPMRLVLVDRLHLVTQQTQLELQKSGWQTELVIANVFDWLPNYKSGSDTGIFAILFLHHFTEVQLRELFSQAAAKCIFFAACDPRRSSFALFGSRLLGAIGCNAVTRHDAIVSVRAGFIGQELTKLWPSNSPWHLLEKETGLFSHGFIARRME